jgi:PHD/YefM family antitoxin component YafN of YafNO toxin-antitoxin module
MALTINDVRYNVHDKKRGETMINTNATNFRKNIFGLLEQTIKYNEPVSINTKDGNAVLVSEEDYNGLMETLYLTSSPSMRKRIIEGLQTPVSDCVPEKDVEW